jgi:hypothetical protein
MVNGGCFLEVDSLKLAYILHGWGLGRSLFGGGR